jgi:isoquinoline 1-oxidoreductase
MHENKTTGINKESSLRKRKNNNSDDLQLSRRSFLKVSGCGIFIFMSTGMSSAFDLKQRGRGYPADLNAYLKIGDDGRVSLYCSKIEMGQGIITSMAQMLAEELDVSLDSIDMVMGDTRLCPWDSGTTGSRSTKYYGPPLRKAGAEARAILLQMASEKLNVEIERLIVKNGIVSDKQNSNRQVTYAELTKGNKIEQHISDVPIKLVSEHTVSGKPIRRMDAMAKVKGEAKYTSDIKLRGMLYAKVLRPPSHDAILETVDVSDASKVKGAIVIKEDDLIAVLHENPDLAAKALDQVSVKWKETVSDLDNNSIFDHLKKSAGDGRVHVEQGNLSEGYETSDQLIESEFYNHYVAHAPSEPYAVLAHAENEKVTIWASTQAPFRVRSTAAETLNIEEDQVHVITPFLGCGLGGKKSGRQITEAVKLSKISGHPVQLAWTRQEEFFYDTFRPAAVVQLKSGLDSKGLITSWGCDILFTGSRSSEPIYNIPNFMVKTSGDRDAHPFGTGAWRGPGSNTNVFAMESHTDILAQVAGMDPLSFRMKNLTDDRMIRVLEAAAEKFGREISKGPSGSGYGISCTNYLNSYVATIAEVSVKRSSGQVKVDRVVCAQDMGEIINPQGAKLQIEGGITMGLSAALSEEIKFTGGKIHSRNYNSYEITKFSKAPKVDIVLIDNPDLAPQGCGEPAITTVGAAIANAIFDAVGARLYTLPMTPERILAAMDK